MDIGFIDLDILLTRIRNPKSKVYFLDAVKAYKAGALRGALTSAWVALVFDLIEKYRQLQAMGDASAAAFIQSWDQAMSSNDIKKLLQLEKDILKDAANKTMLINQLALKHLDRLHDDRHLCAHPAFSDEAALFEPSPELVRLHLVNAIDLVLSQEPLQGKAISEFFDVDVQSVGFPSDEARILDYVEQRYLNRTREKNVHNFGIVLAKSLLKGEPVQWEKFDHKIVNSLIAIRDRAPQAWPAIQQTIVVMLDSLEPIHRERAVAYIATFPDFWPRLSPSTQAAIQNTVENMSSTEMTSYHILKGTTFPQFRTPLLRLIDSLSKEQLEEAIAARPLKDLWSRAVAVYKTSGSYRGSEQNFNSYVAPYSGKLRKEQFDELIDAILSKDQNWDAAETSNYLLGILRNTVESEWPTYDARNRFYQKMARMSRLLKYMEVLTLLTTDGWQFPQVEPVED